MSGEITRSLTAFAPITPRSTRKERQFAHAARMHGKKIDRERRAGHTTPIQTKADFRAQFGSSALPAHLNRHTSKPHEHARAIARRLRQALRDGRKREARGTILAGGHRFVTSRRGLILTEGGTLQSAFA